MKNKITKKLSWLLKLCIFNMLVTACWHAHAEYYLVYSEPEYSDMCLSCHTRPHHRAHKTHAHHHHHYRHNGLYVYYSVPPLRCQCCPHPNVVRSQWGDYVVFSSQPANRSPGGYDEEPSYNPDLTTEDDANADLEMH